MRIILRASCLTSVIPVWQQNTKKSRRSYCDPSALSVSKQSSTGRLTHSKPDSTVSNSLLLRCLASCLSDGGKEECVQEIHQGCPAPIKSTVFRTYSSENLHSETKNAFSSAVSFPLSTEGHTPALPVQRQKLSTFMELPAYRVVIMPYGIHECLRSHRGVDLTGKPRDLAFACYQYKVKAGDCQEWENAW